MADEPIVAWVRAGAAMLGLEAAARDEAAVVENLGRLAAIAAQLEAVEIDADVEPIVAFVR